MVRTIRSVEDVGRNACNLPSPHNVLVIDVFTSTLSEYCREKKYPQIYILL